MLELQMDCFILLGLICSITAVMNNNILFSLSTFMKQ